MKKVSFFTSMLMLLFCSAALSQGASPAVQAIVAKLKDYSSNHIIEKAYLSFDKPYYATGDTMYFKAFLVIGERHEISRVSSILHVDLIGPSNNIISDRLLKINNGTAAGDFTLSDTLKSGIYRVRAYTRYMQNAPDYFFDKPVMISGSSNNNANLDTHQAVEPDLQFFPEGGDLISSLISKVAFKAVDVNGLGVKVKGTIVDNANASVATFASNDLGMGSFYIQPESGKTYIAKVTLSNGKQVTVALPEVKPKGITLHAKDTLGKVSIDIVCNKAYLQENMNKDITLLIYSGGTLKQVTTKLDNKDLGMSLPETQFHSGVMRITLLSQDGEPLSERLVFLQNPDLLNIAVSTNKPSYHTREKVYVNMVTKGDGAGAAGYFSASVLDESAVPFNDSDESTILSYLLLSSELKGYIEKPNYYFAKNTDQARNDLDVLMMTQGYRKFAWKQLANDTTHFTNVGERSLSISGVAKGSNNAPIADREVMLLAVKSGGAMSTRTDKSGRFVFDNIEFEDGTDVSLQATGVAKNKNITKFILDKENEPPVADKPVAAAYAAIMQGYGGKMQTIGRSGNSPADQVLTGSDLNGSSSLTDALKSNLSGVNFISGTPYLKGEKYPMLIVIDGKITGSNVNLDYLTISNIADVKLLKGKNAESYGNIGSSGVLVIDTKYGSSATDQAANNYEVRNATSVTTEKRPPNHDQYRSSNLGGPGHADQVVHYETFRYAPSLSSGLNGVLRGVYFVNGIPYLQGNTVVTGAGEQVEPMYVVLDGSEVRGGIDNINPLAIETVELLKGPNASIYGVQGGSGVLVLTSKVTGDAAPVNTASLGSLEFKAHGFYKAREFYSPKYNVSSQSSTWDFRSTVYWNSNLTTDKDGNGSFDFYNSDRRGSFRIIVQGMDDKGNPGWQVFRYKVE
jgi:hypothetical protein